jgi:hypothetical protein
MGHLKSQICNSSTSQQIKDVCQNVSWLNSEILQEMFAHCAKLVPFPFMHRQPSNQVFGPAFEAVPLAS